MKIHPASTDRFWKAVELLKHSQLPTEDISSGTQLFVAEEGDELLGTIAVEYDYDDALLRSLSVAGNKRSKGVGAALVTFIEDYVKKQGIQNIYLLTTTAADFFSKKGYEQIGRNDVSLFIQRTSEYCSVCPSSATVMRKKLA